MAQPSRLHARIRAGHLPDEDTPARRPSLQAGSLLHRRPLRLFSISAGLLNGFKELVRPGGLAGSRRIASRRASRRLGAPLMRVTLGNPKANTASAVGLDEADKQVA